MHRSSLPTLLCVLFLLLKAAATAETLNGIAAVVNGKVITRSDVRNEVIAQQQALIRQHEGNPSLLRQKIQEVREEALEALIERELILSDFEKLGGTIKPEYVENQINNVIREHYDDDREKFIADLSRAGLSLKGFREIQQKRLVTQYMRGQQASKVEPPTYEEIEKFYKEHLDDYREDDFIKLRTLSVPKYTADPATSVEDQAKLANDLRAQLISGADFADLAKTHSSDGAAASGGDRGWVDRSGISSEMADAAFKVQTGGVSEVIETPGTFTILWIEARRKGKLSSLEEVRDAVENRVKAQKGIAIERKWIDRLRKNAVIKKFD